MLKRNYPTQVIETLNTQGYVVIDDFLYLKEKDEDKDDYHETILTELENEGRLLLEKEQMNIDMDYIGSGEYVVWFTGWE